MNETMKTMGRKHAATPRVGMLVSGLVALPLHAAHVHVQIAYAAGAWDLHIYDFDSGRYDPGALAIPVALAARSTIPDNPQFTRFLGNAGGPVWILPQNEHSEILNLGIGTSQITSGTFAGNQIQLSLHRVEGPGHFAMFTPSPFGAPNVHMTSLDGIDPARDFIQVPAVAGHIHLNWAFTAAGTYRVGLAASGRLNSTGQISRSPVTDYLFSVTGPPAPRFGPVITGPDGGLTTRLTGETGAVWSIEVSDDLSRWTPWLVLTNTADAVQVSLPRLRSHSQQYFRAAQP